jgi:hypothetical protein
VIIGRNTSRLRDFAGAVLVIGLQRETGEAIVIAVMLALVVVNRLFGECQGRTQGKVHRCGSDDVLADHIDWIDVDGFVL